MAPYTRLKPFQRSQILGAVDADELFKDISNQFNILYSTVKYTKCKRDERTEDQQDFFRPGRLQKISNINIERFYRRAKRADIQT